MLSHHPDYKPKHNCSCGAENALFDFIPDTIYGISIRASCCRHDDRFERGGNRDDFDLANREFLSNMLIEIEAGSKWYTPTFLARRRAMIYYEGVVRCGASSFNFHNTEGINV